MIKKMKLWGDIVQTPNGFVFESSHCDGTPFSLPVFSDDVQIAGEFVKDKAQGWLYVIQEGQQDVRCYISLPRPSLQFGKHVTVNQSQLDSRASSVSDFKPRVIGKPKPTLVAKEDIVKIEKEKLIIEPKETVVSANPEPKINAVPEFVSVKKSALIENVKNSVFGEPSDCKSVPVVAGKKKTTPQQ